MIACLSFANVRCFWILPFLQHGYLISVAWSVLSRSTIYRYNLFCADETSSPPSLNNFVPSTLINWVLTVLFLLNRITNETQCNSLKKIVFELAVVFNFLKICANSDQAYSQLNLEVFFDEISGLEMNSVVQDTIFSSCKRKIKDSI